MDERIAQFRVGVLVLATIIVAAILIARIGNLPGIVQDQYTIYVRFPQAPGVTVDTPVLKSGILIGRVTRVTLLDSGGVVVTTRIDANRRLRNNEVCKISTGSILGDAILEFVPSSQQLATIEEYQDGEYLDGIVAQDPLRVMESATTVLDMLSTLEEDVRRALVAIEGAGERVGEVAESMTAIIDNNQDQFGRILTKAEMAMDRFDVAITAIDELIGDEDLKIAIDTALDQVPEIMAETREVIQNLNKVATRADTNLRNIEGLTEPLGQQGQRLADAVESGVEDIDSILGQLVSFTESINNRDGSLGQLIHNRELYDRLDSAATNIEFLSRRLRPIVEDARVFTDKIARDPGRLGIKGALDRSPHRDQTLVAAKAVRERCGKEDAATLTKFNLLRSGHGDASMSLAAEVARPRQQLVAGDDALWLHREVQRPFVTDFTTDEVLGDEIEWRNLVPGCGNGC